MDKSIFATLNSVNCNEHTEKKNGLTYLSWAWAWAEVKKRYPAANYTIYENADGWNYSTDEDYQKAVEDWEYVCDMIDEYAEDRAERRRGHII